MHANMHACTVLYSFKTTTDMFVDLIQIQVRKYIFSAKFLQLVPFSDVIPTQWSKQTVGLSWNQKQKLVPMWLQHGSFELEEAVTKGKILQNFFFLPYSLLSDPCLYSTNDPPLYGYGCSVSVNIFQDLYFCLSEWSFNLKLFTGNQWTEYSSCKTLVFY